MADSSSFGSSSGSSNSTSSSNPIQTPENAILNAISGVASGLADRMLGWAQNTFANTSRITDQAVANFFQTSKNMLDLSGNLTGQYNNLFAPENAQLVADANSYASPARMAVDMGQAGATQAQAGDQALKNSEEALRSYGINPSDGRYAALDKAAAVQNAANVAGAMNTQRNADIDRGQRLRSEAVQVGAQLPAAIANVNNTATQANTGASNATLANANTGRNLMSLPNDFLNTATRIQPPFNGQQSNSTSNNQGTQQSHGSSPDPGSRSGNGGGGAGPGGGGAGPGGGGPAWMPQHGGGQQGGGPQIIQGPGSRVRTTPTGDWSGESQALSNMYDGLGNIDQNSNPDWFNSPMYQPDPNGAMANIGQPGEGGDAFNDYGNPFQSQDFGQTYGGDNNGTFTGSQGAQDTEWGNINYDPSANQSSGWGGGDAFSGDNSGYDPSVWSNDSGSSSYGGDSNATPYDSYSNYGDTGGPDYSSYAGGGPIPPSASPSQGAITDDIPAQGPGGQQLRMNANEFVIPQDVALWKGQEFFQNLIDQSRKRRMTGSAKPTVTPAR